MLGCADYQCWVSGCVCWQMHVFRKLLTKQMYGDLKEQVHSLEAKFKECAFRVWRAAVGGDLLGKVGLKILPGFEASTPFHVATISFAPSSARRTRTPPSGKWRKLNCGCL